MGYINYDKTNKVINGDSLEVLKTFGDNEVDTIITDPPYGLSFMGKKWDYDVPSVELWQECLRVLKPGGTMLCFAGSRTQHRMACNVEDAGFELKDCIMWLYGSGFPKATDISKQLDKVQGRSFDKQLEFTKFLRANKGDYTNNQLDEILGLKEGAFHFFALSQSNNSIPRKEHYLKLKELFGFSDEWDTYIEEAEREVIGKQTKGSSPLAGNHDGQWNDGQKDGEFDITKASTPEAQQWEGWKSHGLKPAYEPILVAVKPNDGTYANNALKWGVSGLNIEESRIPANYSDSETRTSKTGTGFWNTGSKRAKEDGESRHNPEGRFPANIILDEEAGEMLDEQSGDKCGANGRGKAQGNKRVNTEGVTIKFNSKSNYPLDRNDKGGASRFFYCAKAGKKERGEGNGHPTVKPLKLMEYLCTLTKTPTGGTVLDPFAGSGTTLLAAKNTGRDYIGIEREEEYIDIIEARLNY